MICGKCNRGAPFDGVYDATTQCRLCWLYHNSLQYKALIDNQPPPTSSELSQPNNYPKCASKETKTPPIIKQTASFMLATADWVKQGKPTRTDEECQTIHKICENCPEFDAANDRCKKCGCGLSINASTAWIYSIGIPDGIKMATHHCPIGKW